MEGLHFVIAVTDRERTPQVINLFQENNVFTTDVALGEGTAPPEVLDYLYLNPSEKGIVFGVITNTGILPLLKSFKRKLFIDVPGNGIVVAVPINSVGGKKSLEYILDGQSIDMSSAANESENAVKNDSSDESDKLVKSEKPDKKVRRKEMEGTMAVKTDHELIFVVANEGYTDLIMDAARSAGASGGTVIKARGSGAEYTKKFFGFSIASEKELHMIVTPAQGRNHIMQAIMEKAGLESKAQSIVFSLPVSHAIGLRLPE